MDVGNPTVRQYARSLVLAGILIASSASAKSDQTLREVDVSSLTMKQKVGQLFLIGFSGKSVDAKLAKVIAEWPPGGFILFRRNIHSSNQVRDLNASLRSLSLKTVGLSPLLAVDQEGGSVIRVPMFPNLPSAHAVGKTKRADLAFDLAAEKAALLRWSGFNMNLAPVLDLSDPVKPSFIGSRSFGDMSSVAGELGLSYSQGLLSQAVLPTAKHFPGLGSSLDDLHHEKAIFTASEESFRSRDLEPFRKFAEIGPVSAVMISQMTYPFLDSKNPAPFSKKILQDLLRHDLGYNGLIVTDDLQMKGSTAIFDPHQAAVETLKAGADLIMITWSTKDQQKAMMRVLEAVRSGELPEAELDQKVARIIAAKRGLERNLPSVPLARGPAGVPATRKLEKVDLSILDENLGNEGSKFQTWIGKNPTGKVCVLSSNRQFLNSFSQSRTPEHRVLFVRSHVTGPELLSNLKGCDRSIVAVQGSVLARATQSLPAQVLDRTLVINLGLPSLFAESFRTPLVNLGFPHVHSGFRIGQLMRMAIKNKKAAENHGLSDHLITKKN